MRHPQVLVYENDTRLTAMLEDMARENKWLLRHPRELAECLSLLRRGGPAVLVLKVGQHLEFEMTLLERIKYLSPDTAAVVVCETIDYDLRELAGVAWELGADYVLFLPQPRNLLPEIVAGLLLQVPPQAQGEIRGAPA
jgi:DNA-binding response OmpR family regulator